MTLPDYLTSQSMSPSAFAAMLGVQASTITRILHGERGLSLAMAARIRDATAGAVTPDDWFPPRAPASPPEAAHGGRVLPEAAE